VRHLDRDYVVPGDVDDALIQLAAGVAGIRNATAQGDGGPRLVISEIWRPRWTYLVAIVFFPIGLLALLVKSEAVLRADATVNPEGTRIHLHGRGHEFVCDAVLATLRDVAISRVVRE
jgi:hypothetical protein